MMVSMTATLTRSFSAFEKNSKQKYIINPAKVEPEFKQASEAPEWKQSAHNVQSNTLVEKASRVYLHDKGKAQLGKIGRNKHASFPQNRNSSTYQNRKNACRKEHEQF